jgi:NTP pyrophosphatase (non-canonical NTP hydrolase)
MTFDEYQNLALSTAIYPKEYGTIYPALGLCGKTGEVTEKIKKSIRNSVPAEQRDSFREDMIKELGDVLWYVAVLANDLNIPLDDVAENNIQKGPIYRGLDIYPEIKVMTQ